MATTTEKKLPTEQPIVPTWVEATPLTVPPVAPVAPISTVEAIRAAKARANVANVQAQVDTNNLKAPVTPPVAPTTVPPVPQTPWQEVAQRNLEAEWIDVSKLKPLEPLRTPAPTTVKPPITEVSDVEKQAQSSGVPYTMVNGQAQYNPKTREEAIKVLQTGGSFAQESKMTAQAKSSLDKLRKLTALNDTQLADAIYQGKVSAEELNQLKVVNPQVVALAQERSKNLSTAQVQNNVMSTYGTGEIKYTNTALDNLNRTLTEIDSNGDYKTIKDEVYAQYPEMDNLRKNITQTTVDIRGIQEAIRQQANDLKERFKGLPMSTILTMASAKNKPLTDQLYALQDQLTLDSAEYNAQLDQAKDEIEYTLQNNQRLEKRAFDIYGTVRSEEIRQEDIQREDERIKRDIELEEYRYQRELEDGNLIRAEERKNKLEDLKLDYDNNLKLWLLQLGVDPSGMTPEELTANYANAAGTEKAKEDLYKQASLLREEKVVNEDWSESTRWVNPLTGQEINPVKTFWPEAGNNVDMNAVLAGYSPAGQELLSVPDGTVIPTRLDEVSAQNASIRWKECAEYINDIAGTKMGSSYASKQAVCNEPNGWVGSIVAWKPNGSGNYGHTGIIVNEDENNWYVKSSNYVPWTVTTEKIPKEKISNFYTPDSVKQATQQAQETQQPIAKKYANGNVRTAEWILYDKKEVSAENQKVITNDSYKALKASESLNREWQAYKSLIDKYGIEAMPWKARSEMQSAYERVMRQAQTFFNLWVLQKLDEEAVQRMIPMTARWMTDNKYLNPFERDAIAGQVKQVDEMIKSKLQGEYDSLTTIYGSFWDTLSGLNDVKRIYNKNIGTWASDVEEYTNQ